MSHSIARESEKLSTPAWSSLSESMMANGRHRRIRLLLLGQRERAKYHTTILLFDWFETDKEASVDMFKAGLRTCACAYVSMWFVTTFRRCRCMSFHPSSACQARQFAASTVPPFNQTTNGHLSRPWHVACSRRHSWLIKCKKSS